MTTATGQGLPGAWLRPRLRELQPETLGLCPLGLWNVASGARLALQGSQLQRWSGAVGVHSSPLLFQSALRSEKGSLGLGLENSLFSALPELIRNTVASQELLSNELLFSL